MHPIIKKFNYFQARAGIYRRLMTLHIHDILDGVIVLLASKVTEHFESLFVQ